MNQDTSRCVETVLELVTAVDDCSPQVIGYVLERALELGALDAYTTPAQMKKGRPGVVITLLARPAQEEQLSRLLLEETTTLGVRIRPCRRIERERQWVQVETPFGSIRVKAAGEKAMPEYEECRLAARRHGVPLARVQAAALAAWRDQTPPRR
ncbi:MAG: nickel insertion protein [Terriglobales bacterium]